MADLDPKMPPRCFAAIDTVFPMGPDGLRQTPPECLACGRKTECLRAALAREQGLVVHEERLARAYEAGAVGFVERWAQQKNLERRRQGRTFWQRIRERFQRRAR
jgi:hypothetical protein